MLFKHLKGYVILRLYDEKKEINLEKIRKQGAVPYNISYKADGIYLSLSYTDFMRIGNKIDGLEAEVIKAYGGAYLWGRVKRHKILLFGMILLVITMLVGSNFVWTIEYDGVSENKLEEVKQAVSKSGLKVGALKKNLLSPMELKNTILANTRDIPWCWVYIKGTRAVVRVRENAIAPEVFDPDTPCDIVASKDGVIKRITAKRGLSGVMNNTFVARGDVLISGRVTLGEDEEYLVHASGECEAITHYEKEGVFKLYKNHKVYTGKKRNFLTLKLFSLRIPLYFNDKTDFAYSDKEEKLYEISFGKENYIGIGLEKVSFFEYNIIREPISRELCFELAKAELEEKTAQELLPGATLLSSELHTEIIDEETVSVKLVTEFVENIAVEKYIEEVTLIEPKTD